MCIRDRGRGCWQHQRQQNEDRYESLNTHVFLLPAGAGGWKIRALTHREGCSKYTPILSNFNCPFQLHPLAAYGVVGIRLFCTLYSVLCTFLYHPISRTETRKPRATTVAVTGVALRSTICCKSRAVRGSNRKPSVKGALLPY